MRSRRVEVLTGPERRRKWSDETKIAIVAESLADGVVISDVARRHDITRSQLFGGIRQFRGAALATIASARPMFALAVVDAPVPMPSPPLPAEPPAEIEISVGVATVRIRGAVDAKTLAAVLRALRVMA